jgi:hypothetical protein
MRRGLFTIAGAVLALAAAAARAEPPDYDALDDAAKAAIKTACHGWVYEDAANWLAGWLDAVSPLCDAEEQARLRALNPVPANAPSPRPRVDPDYVPTDFGGRGDPVPWLRSECENDYMCTRMRQRALDAGRPVTMDEYRRVADRCEGEYWCIEKAFERLPDIGIPPAIPPAAQPVAPPAAPAVAGCTDVAGEFTADGGLSRLTLDGAGNGHMWQQTYGGADVYTFDVDFRYRGTRTGMRFDYGPGVYKDAAGRVTDRKTIPGGDADCAYDGRTLVIDGKPFAR